MKLSIRRDERFVPFAKDETHPEVSSFRLRVGINYEDCPETTTLEFTDSEKYTTFVDLREGDVV